jgi:DnaJ-class molecular chaperone
MRCQECNGRGEVSAGERHGFHEWQLCPVCKGNTVVPVWKESQRAIRPQSIARERYEGAWHIKESLR